MSKNKTRYEIKEYGLTTANFELVRVKKRPTRRLPELAFKLYVRSKRRPNTLVEVSPLITEAEKTITKLERLYPCHFLAREWNSGHKIRLKERHRGR